MQSIEHDVATTTPVLPGDAPLPKRNGGRGLLPSTWLGRAVRVGYLDVSGRGVETSGTLLDWCGHGPVLNLAGSRTVLSWDALRMVELVED